uniref:Tetratricopeptide repeat protein 1 n=1 Tax=Fusarium oxysporum (strain Fo5176) TaxID=660025 RepID=A0A0D2Y585_FUSOF
MSTTEPSKDDVAKSPDVEKAKDNANSVDGQELKFTPEEEEYQEALDKYDDAINSCPKYLHYPRAVIYSNIAACHIQLEDWKEAIKSASDSLKALEKLEQSDPRLSSDGKKSDEEKEKKEDDDVEEEIISSGASRAAPVPSADDGELKALQANIQRIRCKALMRRARGRSEAGGWHNLAGAEEDCKALAAKPESLAPADLRVVRKQLRDLPPRVKAAQEKEMGEMWGKLKDLGNGILKPFGLSTNNFQMVKDEKTGGYSMNFQPGGSS